MGARVATPAVAAAALSAAASTVYRRATAHVPARPAAAAAAAAAHFTAPAAAHGRHRRVRDVHRLSDLFLHAPALSSGNCATRCHALGRIGYADFTVNHASFTKYDATDLGDASFCYCG